MRRLNPARIASNELLGWDPQEDEQNYQMLPPLRDGWDQHLWWETYSDEGVEPLYFGHRFMSLERDYWDDLSCSFNRYAKIDHDGIKLHDERNELDVEKGGWLSANATFSMAAIPTPTLSPDSTSLYTSKEELESFLIQNDFGSYLREGILDRFLDSTDLPTLPWSTELASIETRREIYDIILKKATSSTFIVQLDGELHLNPWCEGRWHYRGNPLLNLYTQQPHLSKELDYAFYSGCHLNFGDVQQPTLGFEKAVRWLRYIGEERISFIKSLIFYVSADRLRAKPWELPRVLELLADSPPQRDLSLVDFKIHTLPSFTRSEGLPSASYEYRFKLVGLFGVNFTLTIQCEDETKPKEALELIESCLTYTGPERLPSGKALYDDDALPSKLIYARKGRRVNFLQKLPHELILKIFSSLCEEAAVGTRKWSMTFHCPKAYIVCRQFVHEFKLASISLGLVFRTPEYDWTHIRDTLESTGGEVLSQMKQLKIELCFVLDEEILTDWRCQFLWLVNALCHFSLKPESSRRVSSVMLIKAACIKLGDKSNVPDSVDEEKVAFIIRARFRVTLENDSIQVCNEPLMDQSVSKNFSRPLTSFVIKINSDLWHA
ncbi:MAG: hypothetical protein Q9160_005923 [Pyrenula sp. 1 TL-2023]